MIKMKKAALILGIGLGLNGIMSGAASALPGGAGCSVIEAACEAGDQVSCSRWYSLGCWACDSSERTC